MPTAELVKRLAAYFGPPGGGPPDYSAAPNSEWTVERIDESDPAHPVAYFSRATTGFAVERTALFDPREVHIWVCDISKDPEDPDYRVTPIFWGEVNLNQFLLESPERETARGRIERYHYGTPLEGEIVWNPIDEELLTVHGDVRFNPTIDAKTVGNMAPSRDGHADMPDDYNLWFDPESCRTEQAAGLHNQTEVAKKWSLGLAVETLQRVLNAHEDFIGNEVVFEDPDTPEPPFDETEAPENVTLRRGQYLDECLRVLLPPYGCGFYVALTVDDEEGHELRKIRPVLRYYRRGQGEEKDIKLQPHGQALNPAETECKSGDITFDVSRVVNRVVVHGHPQEREVTLELVRTWEEEDDDLDAEDLTRGGEESQFDTKQHVHRKWAANEAGDYTGLRDEITAALDLSTVFTNGYVPRRRRLYPPLTFRGQANTETDGLRAPVKVEYSTDDGDTWVDVTGESANARFIVLENEIGIYFNQPSPPEELIDISGNPENLRLRVTGTIIGDQCMIGEADVPEWVANPSPHTLVINAEDRYFDRDRQDSGPHASVLTGNYDNRNDQDAIDSFAERMRDQAAAASVTGRIVLSGIVTDYAIGDLLTGVSGREISFNRSGDPEMPLYVQVVGRIFDAAKQETTLLSQPYDVPVSTRGTV